MSRTSYDARAVVRAIDALTTRLTDALTNLTTQVKRAADYQQSDFTLTPDAVDDAPTTADDGPASDRCVHRGPHPGFTCAEVDASQPYFRVRWEQEQQAPAAGEDAQHTARRRASITNLLHRLDRNWTLSADERALLRRHVVAEGLEHDTARARAEQAEERAERAAKRTEEHRRLAAHRLTELEQAQAAIERVRHTAALIEAGAPWAANHQDTARRILAALDGTEQPTTEAEGCCGKPAGAICVHDISQPEE